MPLQIPSLAGLFQPPAPPTAQPPATPPPAPQGRSGPPPALLQMLPALFAIGARMGGSPQVGTGALQGFQQGQMLLDQKRQQETQQQQRQQQIDLQAEQQATAQAQLEEQRRIQAEQRRQSAINTSADNLRQTPFKTKAAYDQAVAAHETMLANSYGVRPNTLRAMVPFNGPNVRDEAAKALEPLIKEHGFSKVAGMNAIVEIDRDGDGVMERVPMSEAIKLAGFAVTMDPTTGQPIQAPVKPENVQDFDIVYAGLIDQAKSEGKVITDTLKGQLALQAKEALAKAGKEGTASVVVNTPGEKPMTRYQRFTTERQLRTEAEKAAAPVREINRQVQTMRAGLAAARKGDMTVGVQAVINSFNRILEPGSVTREAEYLRTAAGQSLVDALVGKFESIKAGGQGVRVETLADAVALAEQIAANMSRAADGQFEMIGGQAEEYQIPRDRVIPSLGRTNTPAPAETGPSGVPPAVTSALKSLPDGRHTLSDGSVWEKRGGVIRQVK
jgi:hypothetical protein